MEYIWVSLLNRSEVLFWESTPKILFEQYDIYKKVNGLEEKKEEKVKEVYMKVLICFTYLIFLVEIKIKKGTILWLEVKKQ